MAVGMKLSWIVAIVLMVFVAVFSVQNAEPITVRFLAWQFTISAALIILLAAILGGLIGLAVAGLSRRGKDSPDERSDTALDD